MDMNLIRPVAGRIKECAAEQTADGSYVRIGRCRTCGFLAVLDKVPPEKLSSHEEGKPIEMPGRHTVVDMEGNACQRCTTAMMRSPELFDWVLACIAQAQVDAIEEAERRLTPKPKALSLVQHDGAGPERKP